MKNKKDLENEVDSPIEIWIETRVYDLIKSHSDKYPYYHANIKVLERNDDEEQVKVSIQIDGKGRNETQQNLCLLIIDALKNKKTII